MFLLLFAMFTQIQASEIKVYNKKKLSSSKNKSSEKTALEISKAILPLKMNF